MTAPSQVTPVKLFVATLQNKEAPLEDAMAELRSEWGETDFVSPDFPFDVTDYYAAEMGTSLQRRFYSFANLIAPEQLVEAKLLTNAAEQKFKLAGGGRSLNLDPGYLDYYKVVLASAKFGGQKIHLRDGIYADMTLVMYKGKWMSFAWGFPDFKSGRYDAVLTKIRDLYKAQIRSLK